MGFYCIQTRRVGSSDHYLRIKEDQVILAYLFVIPKNKVKSKTRSPFNSGRLQNNPTLMVI